MVISPSHYFLDKKIHLFLTMKNGDFQALPGFAVISELHL